MSKPTLPVLIYPLAENDLAEITEYLEQNSIDTVNNFLEILEKRFDEISVFPESYHLSNDRFLAEKGYRLIPIGNYLVFYVIQPEQIQIRRILFGRKNYADFL
jgi:plasmid stabilization system protein ParE